MILYFLRMPYEWLEKQEREPFSIAWLAHYLLKPVIGCVICMSSVHTFTVWYLIQGGINLELLPFMVINIFASAGISAIAYNLFDLLQWKINKHRAEVATESAKTVTQVIGQVHEIMKAVDPFRQPVEAIYKPGGVKYKAKNETPETHNFVDLEELSRILKPNPYFKGRNETANEWI